MGAYRDALDALPPWDAVQYFQQVTETVVVLGVAAKQLVGADPNRVALIVSSDTNNVTTMSLNSKAPSDNGLAISSTSPPIKLLFSEVGPLCQQAWFVPSGLSITLTVYAISLYRWPKLDPVPKRRGRSADPSRTA